MHGGGLDELTTTGPSTVLALDHDGARRKFTVDPVELGLRAGDRTSTRRRRAGRTTPRSSAACSAGELGPHRDIVVLNAGAALVVAAAAADLARGRRHRRPRSIDSGSARAATLDAFVATSQEPLRRRDRRPGSGSSANLGPGFDALGMALTLVCRRRHRRRRDEPVARRSTVDEHHPATIAFRRGRRDRGAVGPLADPDGARTRLQRGDAGRRRGRWPWRSGSGGRCRRSIRSARRGVLGVAAELEGHADNVAASRVRRCRRHRRCRVVALPTAARPRRRRVDPDVTTSTDASRGRGCPPTLPFDDAVFNVGRAAMLVAALAAGDVDALRLATRPAASSSGASPPIAGVGGERSQPAWPRARGVAGCRGAVRPSPSSSSGVRGAALADRLRGGAAARSSASTGQASRAVGDGHCRRAETRCWLRWHGRGTRGPGDGPPAATRASTPGPANLEHRHLRSALEFAVEVAAAGQRLKPPLPCPRELRALPQRRGFPAERWARSDARRRRRRFRERLARCDAGARRPDRNGMAAARPTAGRIGWRHSSTKRRSPRPTRMPRWRSNGPSGGVDAAEQLGRAHAGRARRTHTAALRHGAAAGRVARRRRTATTRWSPRAGPARQAGSGSPRQRSRNGRPPAGGDVRAERDAAAGGARRRPSASVTSCSPPAPSSPVQRPGDAVERAARDRRGGESITEQLRALVDTAATKRQPVGVPGPLARDARKAAEFLLRAPACSCSSTATTSPSSPGPTPTLDDQRELLLDAVDGLARRFGVEFVVVFDGAEITGSHARRRRLARVSIHPPA